MARPLRIDVEGALHHVFDRGNRRQLIAEEPLDYRFFLWLVERARQGLDGHLFQGRFGSRLVEAEPHAIWVHRYIARNPGEAGLVTNPAAWEWSSYGALRRGCAPRWLAHDAVLGRFGKDRATAAVEYERLILDEEGPDPPGHVQGLTPDTAHGDLPLWKSPSPTGLPTRRRTSRPRLSGLRSAGP